MITAQKVSIEYREEIRGFFALSKNTPSFGSDSHCFEEYADQGRSIKNKIRCDFRVKISDVDKFFHNSPNMVKISGYIDSPRLGGRLKVSSGKLRIQHGVQVDETHPPSTEVKYLIHYNDSAGNQHKICLRKLIPQGPSNVSWSDVATYSFLMDLPAGEFQEDLAVGQMEIQQDAFAKQMLSYRSSGPSRWLRSNAICRLNEILFRRFWDRAKHELFDSEPDMWEKHIIPCNSNEGVRGVDVQIYPFSTKDGLGLSLSRFGKGGANGAVFLVHGLTTSTDMFIMPEHYNIVQYLVDHGYDVWSLDWRGSRRFPYNLQVHKYSMDHVGLYDIPPALNIIRQEMGPDVEIHAISHCVGAIALMISLAAGRANGLSSIIANSASLTPTVHPMAKLKIMAAPDLLEYVLGFNYISPDFGNYAALRPAKWLSKLVSMAHNECDDAACHMISFMWGWGNPAAYVHRNISPITHNRLKDLFGGTSVHYYRHLRKMILAGSAVPYIGHRALPNNYLDTIANMDLPPIKLCSGRENRIFPNSNLVSYEELKQISPRANIQYQEFRDYGHQDIFIGRASYQDVFPSFLKFIQENSQSKPQETKLRA